jgi:hypothetical protein
MIVSVNQSINHRSVNQTRLDRSKDFDLIDATRSKQMTPLNKSDSVKPNTPLNKNSMREQPKIEQVELTANNSPTKQFAIQHSSFDQTAKKIGERIDCDDVEQVGETKADTKEYFSIDFISHSMTDASSSNYDSTTPPIRIDYEDGKETSAREELNTFVDILSQENPELLDFNVNKQARLEALENLSPHTYPKVKNRIIETRELA